MYLIITTLIFAQFVTVTALVGLRVIRTNSHLDSFPTVRTSVIHRNHLSIKGNSNLRDLGGSRRNMAAITQAVGTSSLAKAAAEAQLKAYNERNLDEFLRCFSDDVKVYSYPDTLILEGKAAMTERYVSRFNDKYLYSHVTHRLIMEHTAIDQEMIRITMPEGIGIWHLTAIYSVSAAGLIFDVRFIQGSKVLGAALPPDCGAIPVDQISEGQTDA